MQLPRRFLLKPAGNEGRDGIPFLFFPFNRVDDKLFPLNRIDDALRLGLCRNRGLLAIDTMQLGFEWRRIGPGQRHRNGPVFLGAEGFPFLFPFANQPHRHGLDPAHAEAAPHLGPEQLTALVSDDPVKHPAGLLRIHQLHIDLPGRLQRALNGRFRDFVETHTEDLTALGLFLGLGFGLPEQFLFEMPGDGFAFSIRVRRQEHFVAGFRLGLNLRKDLRFALDRHILRFEIVFHVDAQLAGGQILNMPDRRHDGITTPQILADGAGFRRRLNNDQCLGHENSGSLWGYPSHPYQIIPICATVQRLHSKIPLPRQLSHSLSKLQGQERGHHRRY